MNYNLRQIAIILHLYTNRKNFEYDFNSLDTKNVSKIAGTIKESQFNIIFKISQSTTGKKEYKIPLESAICVLFFSLVTSDHHKEKEVALKDFHIGKLKNFNYESTWYLSESEKEAIKKDFTFFLNTLNSLKLSLEKSNKQIDDFFDTLVKTNVIKENYRTLNLLLSSCDENLDEKYFPMLLTERPFISQKCCEEKNTKFNKLERSFQVNTEIDDFDTTIERDLDEAKVFIHSKLEFKYTTQQIVECIEKLLKNKSSHSDISTLVLYENLYILSKKRISLPNYFCYDSDISYFDFDANVFTLYSHIYSLAYDYLISIKPNPSDTLEIYTKQREILDDFITNIDLNILKENLSNISSSSLSLNSVYVD